MIVTCIYLTPYDVTSVKFACVAKCHDDRTICFIQSRAVIAFHHEDASVDEMQ